MTIKIIPQLASSIALICLFSQVLAAAPPSSFGAVPTEHQLAWQRMEYYGFVHFGLNTWTDREWGYGDEDPKLFNPASFDARAIVRQFKDAGMTGMILTAKHHDGFCLWPTKTTPHNISKSPWKDGKGDLIKEFADACQAEDFKLGIYVSPWDRNHAEYAREGYVNVFHEQIREVLTNYGPVFEIWFDGANGGDGFYGGAKETRKIPDGYYRFPEAVKVIRQLQPKCVIWAASDARWGGSEEGHVAYPHWHTMDSKQGGNGASGVRHGDKWMPAEGDVSIRNGWFWHEYEDGAVKSPGKLLKIWLDSVGRGANLIVNVPPDRDGKIREPDLKSLMAFRDLRDSLQSKNFAAGAVTQGASRAGFPAAHLTDNDIESYWTTDDGAQSPTAEIQLAGKSTFDVIRLREQIRLGQRVDAFKIDAWIDGDWKQIHAGKTIGNQVLARLASPITSDRLRLRITESAAVPCISEFSLLKLPATQESMTDTRISKANVAKLNWKIIASTASDGASAANAIDGDPDSFWHTHGMSGEQNPPQGFDVDLGENLQVSAFTYLPRQDHCIHGMTDKYRFELSQDGSNWTQVAEGEFSNIRANPTEQIVSLKNPMSARYLRFTGLRALEKNHVSAAEIGVISAP